MEKEVIDNLIIDIANEKIKEIMAFGYIKPGVNGPYDCVDTPVRNSAHWCVTFSYLYNLTKKEEYNEMVKILADYILECQKQTASGAIKCMNDTKFTDTNGLVGQAWAIEGLFYAYRILNNKDYLDCAVKIFNSQKFDYQSGQWYQIDTNNKNQGFDVAFNHQLWFAAIGYELNSVVADKKIEDVLNVYMSKINKHFQIYSNGLIRHLGDKKVKIPYVNRIKKIIKSCYPTFLTKRNPDKLSVFAFEAAYQLFNLYAFGIIKKYNNDLPFFRSAKFNKALKYGLNVKKMNKIFNVHPTSKEHTCKYAYLYNSPAFEYGFVAKMFCSCYDKQLILDLIKIQLDLSYSDITKCFDKNTNDPNTLTARIYELVRFLEVMDNE